LKDVKIMSNNRIDMTFASSHCAIICKPAPPIHLSWLHRPTLNSWM